MNHPSCANTPITEESASTQNPNVNVDVEAVQEPVENVMGEDPLMRNENPVNVVCQSVVSGDVPSSPETMGSAYILKRTDAFPVDPEQPPDPQQNQSVASQRTKVDEHQTIIKRETNAYEQQVQTRERIFENPARWCMGGEHILKALEEVVVIPRLTSHLSPTKDAGSHNGRADTHITVDMSFEDDAISELTYEDKKLIIQIESLPDDMKKKTGQECVRDNHDDDDDDGVYHKFRMVRGMMILSGGVLFFSMVLLIGALIVSSVSHKEGTNSSQAARSPFDVYQAPMESLDLASTTKEPAQTPMMAPVTTPATVPATTPAKSHTASTTVIENDVGCLKKDAVEATFSIDGETRDCAWVQASTYRHTHCQEREDIFVSCAATCQPAVPCGTSSPAPTHPTPTASPSPPPGRFFNEKKPPPENTRDQSKK